MADKTTVECVDGQWILLRRGQRRCTCNNRKPHYWPETTWAGPFLSRGHALEWLMADGLMRPISEGLAKRSNTPTVPRPDYDLLLFGPAGHTKARDWAFRQFVDRFGIEG